MPIEDLTGCRFHRWTVIEMKEPAFDSKGRKYHRCLCRCDCGTERIIRTNNLKMMRTRSCGCFDKDRWADYNKTSIKNNDMALHRRWSGIKTRCYNPNSSSYHNYGARGIKMCDEWRTNFRSFQKWAYENGYSPGTDLSLDRIDNDGDYCPENCRFTNKIVQSNNTRVCVKIEHEGTVKTITEWSRETGIPAKTIWYRYHHGFNDEEIFSKEHLKKKRKGH